MALFLRVFLCSVLLLLPVLASQDCLTLLDGTTYCATYTWKLGCVKRNRYKIDLEVTSLQSCAYATKSYGAKSFMVEDGQCYGIPVTVKPVNPGPDITLLFYTSTTSDTSNYLPCPEDYDNVRNKWCLAYRQQKMTYPEAKQNCSASGGYLMNPTESNGLDPLRDFFFDPPERLFWSGAENVLGTWRWMHTNREVQEEEWRVGFPVQYYFNCATMDSYYDGLLTNRAECYSELFLFICRADIEIVC